MTHTKIYAPPSTLDQALDQIAVWLASPSVTLLAENADHWTILSKTLKSSRIVGPKIRDARVAALCIAHGVRELWTSDRDFSAFPGLNVRNPLVGTA